MIMCSSLLTLGLRTSSQIMGTRILSTPVHLGTRRNCSSSSGLNPDNHSSSDSVYSRLRCHKLVSLNCLRNMSHVAFGRQGISELLWTQRGTFCRAAVWGESGDAEVEGATTKRKPHVERSETANEELLLFFFQLDLTTRLQRALNQDMYDVAQQLREKIAEVEQEVVRQREAKMGSVSSKDEAQDKAITILQLKAELQKLIQEEDYAGAGAMKNKISALEAESLAAQAKAMVYRQLNFHFHLGQKIKHRVYGYRGVICGMDPLCCESTEWAESAGVDELPRGRSQPFYQVLVDVREEPTLMVTYVAEDNLTAPEEPDMDQFDHPYVYFLFYGMDGAGDFIACKQLREKYNSPRRELPRDEEEDDSSPSGTGGPD